VTIHIPDTLEEAVESLNGIDNLLTAKGWERAAIVAAFVRLPDKRTVDAFTARGIAGLTHEDTVRRYVLVWLAQSDGVYPEPGADVELPAGPAPITGTTSSTNTPAKAIETALRNGTLINKLTPEQKVDVASAILADAEPVEREAIEAKADVHIFSGETVRNTRRAEKEREAGTTPFYVNDARWLVKTITALRVALTERPDVVVPFFDQIDLMKAEFAVDGKITVENEDFRAWAEASND